MAKVIFGNHMAVVVARLEQDRIREFYCDVLGCTVKVKTNEVDRLELNSHHFCFIYKEGLQDETEFLRSGQAVWLEIKSDNMEGMERKILDFGVVRLDIPDPHLYFQAPGGQVFRLVGINEDLSVYEESASSRPRSSASET